MGRSSARAEVGRRSHVAALWIAERLLRQREDAGDAQQAVRLVGGERAGLAPVRQSLAGQHDLVHLARRQPTRVEQMLHGRDGQPSRTALTISRPWWMSRPMMADPPITSEIRAEPIMERLICVPAECAVSMGAWPSHGKRLPGCHGLSFRFPAARMPRGYGQGGTMSSRTDAATGLLDIRRLNELLSRIRGRIVHKPLAQISPLAVPILLEIGKERVNLEGGGAMGGEAADALIAEAMGEGEWTER